MMPLYLFALCFLTTVMIVAWPMSEEDVVNRLRWLKQQDRDLQLSGRQIAIGATVGIVCLGVALWQMQLPTEIQNFVGLLFVYVPATFFFNCVVFHVGARRELLFACFFLTCCLLSVLATGWPHLEFIIPVTALFTALQCLAASKDAYTHYRKGLRILFRGEHAESAVSAFERAVELKSDSLRYKFHLGRALLASGDTAMGRDLIDEVLTTIPDFAEQLSKDVLFDDSWLKDVEQ